MSGISFVADTNFLIYVLEGRPEVAPYLEYHCAVSVITEIELLGWHKISYEEKEKIAFLLESCVLMELTEAIKNEAISLRIVYKLTTADAIVAATAITMGLPLLTADKKLAKISQVQLIIIE